MIAFVYYLNALPSFMP